MLLPFLLGALTVGSLALISEGNKQEKKATEKKQRKALKKLKKENLALADTILIMENLK